MDQQSSRLKTFFSLLGLVLSLAVLIGSTTFIRYLNAYSAPYDIDLKAAPAGYELPADIQLSEHLSADAQDIVQTTFYNIQVPAQVLGEIRIKPLAGVDGVAAYTDYQDGSVYIDVSTQKTLLSYILVHELGHIVDSQLMTEQLRDEYCELREISNCSSWASSTYRIDGDKSKAAVWETSPAEDFAEEFVKYALDDTYPNRSIYPSTDNLDSFWEKILEK